MRRTRATLMRMAPEASRASSAAPISPSVSGVVGMGSIGREVARVASEFGMRTIGVKRTVAGVDPASFHADVHPHFSEEAPGDARRSAGT